MRINWNWGRPLWCNVRCEGCCKTGGIGLEIGKSNGGHGVVLKEVQYVLDQECMRLQKVLIGIRHVRKIGVISLL